MRVAVRMPRIPPAKHHIVDLPPSEATGGVDRARLVAWAKSRAKRYTPATTVSHLVAAAIYEGFAERVSNREFG